jgi:hypothetical protein
VASIHGSPGDPGLQMPAVTGAGTEPVPYTGPGVSTEPPVYAVDGVSFAVPGAEVMNGIPATYGVQESGYAHDLASSTVAPYYPGALSPINAMGDDDPGGRDDVAGTVAASVTAAEARYLECQSDTFGQGSTIGDVMALPFVPENATTPDSNFLWAGGDQPGKGTPRPEDVG